MTPDATPLTGAAALVPTTPGAPFSPSPLWGALALLLLAAFAFVLSRRRARNSRRLELLESMSLGPRRSVCLARVDGRMMVLGVSEAGVQLLTHYDAPAEARPGDVSSPEEVAAFENLLFESTSEQQLRERLWAARQGGVSP